MDRDYTVRVIVRAEVARDRLNLMGTPEAKRLADHITWLRADARRRRVADISSFEAALIEAEPIFAKVGEVVP